MNDCIDCTWCDIQCDGMVEICRCTCTGSPSDGEPVFAHGDGCEEFSEYQEPGDDGRIILRGDKRDTWMGDDEAEQRVMY